MRSKYLFLLLIFLSACVPQTETVIVENTSTLTYTPEIVNTVTPLPTATLSEVDEIFVIPTMDSSFMFDTTPTPLATPFNSSIQLRVLSENDYINWIRELQTYSYQNYPPYGDWRSDGAFIASQLPLALVIQEFLYRYPNSVHAERLKWQLAFIDSIYYRGGLEGNAYNRKWIVEQLESSLNRQEMLPSELELGLTKTWFYVDYYQEIDNFFGDNKIAWFYVITSRVWAGDEDFDKTSTYSWRGGLFIAAHEVGENKFELVILEDALDFANGDSWVFDVSDHNKNGTPEIALYIGSHNGTMCGGNLKIYEWKNNKLIELTKGQVTLNDCGLGFEYLYRNGVSAIRSPQIFPSRTYYYVWDGNYYEFSESTYISLLDQWGEIATDSGSTFAEEINLIEKILDSETQEGLDNAHIDFLRYRLGILYALDSKDLIAKDILNELVDNPNDKTRSIYSEAATTFLEHYSGDFGINNACQYSRSLLDGKSNNLDYEEIEELFGIPFDFNFGHVDLRCYEWDIFETLIEKTEINMDIPIILSQNQLHPHYINKFDVNRDGIFEEWLILFDGGFYLVVPTHKYYKFHKISLSGSVSIGYSISRIKSAQVLVEPSTILNQSLISLKTENEFSLFRVDENYDVETLHYDYDVESLTFDFVDTPARFEVTYIKPKQTEDEFFYGVPWYGYRWDDGDLDFKYDLFEYSIFMEKDITKSVEIADYLVGLLNEWNDFEGLWYTPRYYYLCALAYELAGDSQKAAEIYYQLWREFPESHYARLAKFKLEPITP